MTRLLVIEHEPDDPVSWLGQGLGRAGVDLVETRPYRGEFVPTVLPTQMSGLIVLGGSMGAGDDAAFPWLASTRALIRDTVARGIPLLGICLGHQLTALALGGRVDPNRSGRTLGLTPVTLTASGTIDPLLAGSDGAVAVHYNADVVTDLPQAATTLALAPDGTVQAARFGQRAWGVQFHPEVTPETFDHWIAADPAVPPATAAALSAGVHAARATLATTWQPLADRFAAQLLPAGR